MLDKSKSMKSFLQNNDIEMYSIHNERKFVIAEKFIRNLKNNIYKHMTSASKHVYTDKLDDIVNKYNNTYHSTIKMRLANVNSNTYINSKKKLIIKVLNLKLVVLLEYKILKRILQKVALQIDWKKFLWLKKLKILCRGHMLLMILMEKKLLELFTDRYPREKVIIC